jgi:hypothetical protein
MALQSNEHDMESQHGSTSTLQADRAPLTIQQRRRSQSASFFIPSPTSPHRLRTKTGPSTAQDGQFIDEQPSSSHSRNLSGSSSRFVTSSTDFHLPKRNAYASTSTATSISPNSSGLLASSALDGSQDSLSSLPLFRRKAAAAVLAHASRKGYRRGSMLGKVIAGNEASGEDDGDDDDMEADEEEDDLRLSESPMLDKDEDDEMQVDTGDTILAETTGSSSPPLNMTSRGSGTTTAVRRAVQRRTNLMPKDRGVLRVAATLRDETRPGEGEIASEAKLQRRLGPESDSMAPTTPKLMARRSQSPFGPSSGGLIDRNIDGDELYFPEASTQYDLSDDSYDGDDDMLPSKSGATAIMDSEESHQAGIAIPGTNGQAVQKDKLWLNFREAGNPRLSPGTERITARSRGASVTPGGMNIGTVQLSGSLGSALDQAMELEMFTQNTGSSPSLWGRSAKRKVGDDRYDPYSSSAIHKRRAVSPIAFISATSGSGRATATTSLSPGLLSQVSPIYNPLMANLPTPTPLSIPSPTLSFSRGPGGLSGSFPRSYPSIPANRSASRNASPSSTRPSTPTNVVTSNPFAANPSPSILSTHASKQGGGGGGNGGSGPGYGSGALGLSLGGGSKRFKQEQQEMEEEEGMLGDVSAIQLGEM